mgnify:CR=1 FL=1
MQSQALHITPLLSAGARKGKKVRNITERERKKLDADVMCETRKKNWKTH